MTRMESGLLSKSAQSNRSVVMALVVLLALAGAGAWWLQLGEAAIVASLLALAVVGLAAIGFRTTLGQRPRRSASRRVEPVVMAASRSAVDVPNAVTDNFDSGPSGKHWSLEVFAAIDAQRFAAVCETWFSWAGFDTRSQAHPTEEGVDIWLHAPKVPGPVAIVRCKHWPNKPVGLLEMKEFLGLVAKFKSAHGTYTTTSTYTPEALEFAKEHGIEAVDGRGLLRRIRTRTRQSQQALLAVAYSNHH